MVNSKNSPDNDRTIKRGILTIIKKNRNAKIYF